MAAEGGSAGWTWQGHLSYYDYQTKTEKQFKKVSKLKDELDKEGIVHVYKCFHPLAYPMGKVLHGYVIFGANKNGTIFFHSIEKNQEDLVWQRSHIWEDVIYRLKNEDRPSGQVSKESDVVVGDIYDLIDWLDNETQITRKYNVLFDNCQHFAKSVYEVVFQFKEKIMMTHPTLSAAESDADMYEWFQGLNEDITRVTTSMNVAKSGD
ncbi:uncharacterized protein LOC128209233 [Mya arenaria]|uniref:uncharacterized protein LOC128209233 n=1 Tax=Mya arenaria TaxID=6604 RepID=UPI0022E330B2|nr:uncharacterized protein LOC128209233 [Mya arenaria]